MGDTSAWVSTIPKAATKRPRSSPARREAAKGLTAGTTGDKITVIRNEGKPDMEIITKEGQKVTRFKASGASGSGDGQKAGTAYRMKDGTMVYVPAGNP